MVFIIRSGKARSGAKMTFQVNVENRGYYEKMTISTLPERKIEALQTVSKL